MITLTQILSSIFIDDLATVLEGNFVAIKTHIDDLEEIIGVSNATIKLTNLTTLPANSIEASGIVLTKTTGLVITVSPNGGAVTYSVDANGDVIGRKATFAGTGVNKSIFGEIQVSGDAEFAGDTTIGGLINIKAANSRIAYKYRVATIDSTNVGDAATTPIDISKDTTVYLDYDNGGVALGSNAEIKLDTSGLVEGQIIKFVCLRTNATGQRIYNGGSGTEVFAKVVPASGFAVIAAASKPEFSPAASPNSLSFIEAQWTNIGGGIFKLVITDYKNATSVS